MRSLLRALCALTLVSLGACTLITSTDELEFDLGVDMGTDAGVDADSPSDSGSDTRADTDLPDTMPAECDDETPCARVPNRDVRCESGECVDLGCDPGFDDCDDVMANGCEVSVDSDATHCGACGRVCGFTNAAASCESGACRFDGCLDDFADCDGTTDNGCEANLRLPATCGTCVNSCADGLVCLTSRDPFQCAEECDDATTLCGASCIDTTTDATSCGECDRVCPPADNGSPICADSACDFVCIGDFLDCDDDAASDDTDGCEIDSANDPMNCGACGRICEGGNADWTCSSGLCEVDECEPRFADCGPGLGCETDTRSDSNHCGACGEVCDGMCVDGVCDPFVDGDGGVRHTCALRLSGEVWCWGESENGQTGQGIVLRATSPAPVVDSDDTPLLASVVTCGENFSCAISEDRASVHCWGQGDFRNLGDGTNNSSSNPVQVVSDDPDFGTSPFVDVSGGFRTMCALDELGRVFCWGDNTTENLVAGREAIPGGTTSYQPRALEVSLPEPATELAVGVRFGCALLDDETVVCWGRPGFGVLGQGDDDPVAGPTRVPGLSGVTRMEAGQTSVCAIASGDLFCWGRNVRGTLGLLDTADRNSPARVIEGGVRDVALTREGGCAITDDGVFCWGRRAEGCVGDGAFTPSQLGPLRIDDLPGSSIGSATELFAGSDHVCAISGGRTHCWGSDAFGQLGIDDSANQLTPRPIAGADVVTQIGGGSRHSCVIDGGALLCFGDVTGNRVNSARTLEFESTPIVAASFEAATTAIDTGLTHACAIRSGGVACFGSNRNLKLGVSGTATYGEPALVPPSGWIDVAAGAEFSCALHSSGEVQCFGENTFGQLGRDTGGADGAPGVVTGVAGAMAVAAGQYRGCAIVAEGGTQKVRCWGGRFPGATPFDSSGVLVQTSTGDLEDVIDLQLGRFHACALVDADDDGDGVPFCWGDASFGATGPGAMGSIAAAVPVDSDAVSVSAGYRHSCAALVDGRVMCWGVGASGEIADPTYPGSEPVPQLVAGASDVISLDSGHFLARRTLAIRRDGTALCWGDNRGGACGGGETMYFSTPQPSRLP